MTTLGPCQFSTAENARGTYAAADQKRPAAPSISQATTRLKKEPRGKGEEVHFKHCRVFWNVLVRYVVHTLRILASRHAPRRQGV
jgi:hypothetical protein